MLQMIRGWLSRNGWAVGVFGDAKHDWIPFHWNGALCASMCDVCAYQLFSLVRRVSNQNQNKGHSEMAATIAFEVKSREQTKKNSHQDSRWLPYVDYLNETKQKYRESATAGATRELNSFTTRSARCVRKTQNTIHIIVSCMHAQFTFTGSNMQRTGRWVDNVTPLFLSLSMAFQSKLQCMFFYRRRNLRPRWSTTKVHASQLPYFDHKKKTCLQIPKVEYYPIRKPT